MATNNATNTSNPITVGQGGTGVASTTAYAVVCGGTTSTAALQPIASVGTSGQVLTSNGAGALPTFQAAAAIGGTVTTQATTSGTSYTITVSSSSKLIIVNLISLSGSGTDTLLMQLGTAGGLQTTGYNGNTGNLAISTNWSTAAIVFPANAASSIWNGTITLACTDTTNNVWGITPYVSEQTGAANKLGWGAGNVSLSAAITQLKLFWSGANSFDAGSFGVLVYT